MFLLSLNKNAPEGVDDTMLFVIKSIDAQISAKRIIITISFGVLATLSKTF